MGEIRHVVLGKRWGAYGAETVLRVLEEGEALPEGARSSFGFVDAGRASELVASGFADWYAAADLAPVDKVKAPAARPAPKRPRRGGRS